jgi:hypothetical protein
VVECAFNIVFALVNYVDQECQDHCRNADSTVSTLNGLNVDSGQFFSCNVVNMS